MNLRKKPAKTNEPQRRSSPIVPLALSVALALATLAPAHAETDWKRVDARSISVFHNGATPFEWIESAHPGAAVIKSGQPCIVCHETKGGLDFTGKRLAPREPDAAALPKTVKFPVSVQAAYDKDTLSVRVSFKPPADAPVGSDSANDLKAAIMLLDDKVPQAALAGCWTSCHQDLRGIPGGDAKKGKYVAAGKFELLQWQSGKSSAKLPAGAKAEGAINGDQVSVVFTRKLGGYVAEGRSVPFGIAIHVNHAAGRMHYVSLGYRLAIGAAAQGEVRALKQ